MYPALFIYLVTLEPVNNNKSQFDSYLSLSLSKSGFPQFQYIAFTPILVICHKHHLVILRNNMSVRKSAYSILINSVAVADTIGNVSFPATYISGFLSFMLKVYSSISVHSSILATFAL